MKYKNLRRKFLSILFITLIISISTISCASTKNSENIIKTKITKLPERMFWEIKRGEASIFVLGTIHVADKNFYPIEETIINEFDSADEIYSEIGDLEELNALPLKLQKMMMKSMNLEPEKNLSNFLAKEDIKLLYKEFGKKNIEPLLSFDPWILAWLIPQMIYQKNGLNPAYGIDMYFIKRAKERKINALESADLQFDIISSGTFEEQLKRLYESMESLKNLDQSLEEMHELREAYLENDTETINKMLKKRTKIEKGMTDEEYEEFTQKLLIDRNIAWAKIFDKLLGDGKTAKKVFVFAGTGHFIGENSVFDFLTNENKREILKEENINKPKEDEKNKIEKEEDESEKKDNTEDKNLDIESEIEENKPEDTNKSELID